MNVYDNADNWGGGAPGTRWVDVCRVTVPWAEGNGWNDGGSIRGTGIGATWNCANDLNINNQKADGPTWSGTTKNELNGGSFAAPTAPGLLFYNGLKGEVSWDVTADVLAGASNGWVIKKRMESQNGKVWFYSKEGGTGNQVPRLVLEFGAARLAADNTTSPLALNVYPNPAAGYLSVNFNSKTSGSYQLKVIDLTGRTILISKVDADEGNNNITLNLSNIATGTYMLTIDNGSVSERTMIIIH
jgi:hypothetical protein